MNWSVVSPVVATLVGLTVLLGLIIRFGLLPYIKGQLIDPIVKSVDEALAQVHVISKAWDHHLNWSQQEVDRIWARLLRDENTEIRRRQQDT